MGFVAMFTSLTFVKVFHWLVQDRVDYIEVTPAVSRWQHARIVAFLAVLWVRRASRGRPAVPDGRGGGVGGAPAADALLCQTGRGGVGGAPAAAAVLERERGAEVEVASRGVRGMGMGVQLLLSRPS